MPGIVGFTNSLASDRGHRSILQQMQEFVTHLPFYQKDELFSNKHVHATRSHINVLQMDSQPFNRSGIYVWLDGEFYNRAEVSRKLGLDAKSDPEFLAQFFERKISFDSLQEIDGFYAAAVCDSKTERVYLLCDRYGLRHLYWTVTQEGLAWSSEVKAMLALPAFDVKIDPVAAKQFMELGYLLNDRTWFKDVHLLDSGSVLEWDITKQCIVKQHRYWWWDSIPQRNQAEITDDLVDELGDIFRKAVERRCNPNERVGLMLSGGLDSRAILSAVPEDQRPLHSITFGQPGCVDFRLAERASRVKNATHHAYDINTLNWLDPRIAGTWWTDGQFDLQHMHAVVANEFVRDKYSINLNGYAGDLILGGSYLSQNKLRTSEEKSAYIEFCLNCDKSLFDEFDIYSELPSTDFNFLQNHVRRFTYGGTKYGLVSYEARKPFYDNGVMEFAYSLSDDLRRGGILYKAMLLKEFPEFFETIPNQHTGVPIGSSKFITKTVGMSRRIRGALCRRLNRVGIKDRRPLNYTNYKMWLRREPAWSFLNMVLSDRNAIYPEYCSREHALDALVKHRHGTYVTTTLCRYLTMEIWLQQVLTGRYRPKNEPNPQIKTAEIVSTLVQ